jgi:hypothetical protein
LGGSGEEPDIHTKLAHGCSEQHFLFCFGGIFLAALEYELMLARQLLYHLSLQPTAAIFTAAKSRNNPYIYHQMNNGILFSQKIKEVLVKIIVP